MDSIREKIEKYPLIKAEDTSQFYDMYIFNRCVHTQNVLLTLECWAEVHPSRVTLPVNWNFSLPYSILYPLEPDKNIQWFLNAAKKRLLLQNGENEFDL